MTTTTPIRVAIVGGGIGGLTLLLGLLEHTSPIYIQPHLYETAPAFGEIGAGIAFGSNSIRAMELLKPAIATAYKKHATFHSDDSARERKVWSTYSMGMDGKGSNTLKAGDHIHEVRGSVERSSVHRARFLEAMTDLLPDGYVSFGKKLIDLIENSETNTITLVFEDGTTMEADAVIGCDGIKSRIRQILLGDQNADAAFTGKYAYRGLIPMGEATAAVGEWAANNAQFYWGYDGHVLTFPIEHGKTMNVVAFRTKDDGKWDHGSQWVLPGDKTNMLREFEDWGDDVKAILGMMTKTDIWALCDHPPADTYYKKGNICLLGDAAHATTPHQGSGAGMAIEDAFVLSHLLSHIRNKSQLESVFAAYDTVRRPRTQKLVTTSREAGELYEFQKPGVGDDVDALRANLDGRMRWVWDIDLVQHLKEAELLFREYNGQSDSKI
ncbi:hypothetical protein FE257_002048 [Aspergillus nanangensis]|uniref:FAD-binding domain-containing protein n=1 Tax=Aspergillus nanangensis TaxID=2582783 RepID=A0AAD4GWX1_ASPNN|nr:hypothetical protein FE257_002048 [Aspergillus nanangensis]